MTWQQTLTQAAADLTEPYTVTHTRWTWDRNRNKKLAGQTKVELPGLLEQLYAINGHGAATVPTEMSAHRSPGSKPPLNLEACSAHAEISTQVMQWMGELKQEWLPGGVLPNLRALAYVGWWSLPAYGVPLSQDMTRWRNMCLVMTGAEKLFRPRSIHCPSCLRYRTLRVNLTARAAWCQGCGKTWDTVASLAAQASSDLRSVQMAAVSLQSG